MFAAGSLPQIFTEESLLKALWPWLFVEGETESYV
jgi:hypothetical protein